MCRFVDITQWIIIIHLVQIRYFIQTHNRSISINSAIHIETLCELMHFVTSEKQCSIKYHEKYIIIEALNLEFGHCITQNILYIIISCSMLPEKGITAVGVTRWCLPNIILWLFLCNYPIIPNTVMTVNLHWRIADTCSWRSWCLRQPIPGREQLRLQWHSHRL